MNRDFYGWRGELPSQDDGSSKSASSDASDVDKANNPPAISPISKIARAASARATEAEQKAKTLAAAALKKSKADPSNSRLKVDASMKAKAAQAAKAKAEQANAALANASGEPSHTKIKVDSANSLPDVVLHLGESETVTVSASTTRANSGGASAATKSSAGSTNAGSATGIFAVDSEGKLLTRPRPFVRLRDAAFPAVDLGTASSLGVDATIPAAGVLSIFAGASRETVSQVRISASNVVEDQLPLPAIYAASAAFFATPSGQNMMNEGMIRRINSIEQARMRQKLNDMGPKAIKQCGDWYDSPPVFAVISQVFYAYTFDFDVGNKVGYAAALAAKLTTPSATGAIAATTTSSSAPSTGAALPASADPYLPDRIQASDGPAGGGFHIEYGQTGNLVLKETFKHPLAFGYIGDALYSVGEVVRPAPSAAAGTPVVWRSDDSPLLLRRASMTTTWPRHRDPEAPVQVAARTVPYLSSLAPVPGAVGQSQTFDPAKPCSANNFDPLYCTTYAPPNKYAPSPVLPPISTMRIIPDAKSLGIPK